MQGITSKRILAIAAKYSIMPEAIDEILEAINGGPFLIAIGDDKIISSNAFYSIENAKAECEAFLDEGYNVATILKLVKTCKTKTVTIKEWVDE